MNLLATFLDKCEAAEAKATSGKWFYESYKDDHGNHSYYIIHDNKTGYGDDTIADTLVGISSIDSDKKEEKENADFITFSRNNFARLVQMVRIQAEALNKIQDCYNSKYAEDALSTVENLAKEGLE